MDSCLHPLAQLLDCLEEVLAWVEDRDGRSRWIDRAFLVNFSLEARRDGPDADPDVVLGKNDYDLSPAFLADQFRLDDEHVLAGHRVVNRIEQVGQIDGLAVWNLTSKIPLVDAEGAIIGTAGLTRTLSSTGRASAPGSGFGPVLAHIRDQYQGTITNRQLARVAHMSVRAFERKFRANFHLTPQKYNRKLRLRMASRALVYTRARWPRSRSAAASPTRATPPASSAATSAGPRATTATTTPKGDGRRSCHKI